MKIFFITYWGTKDGLSVSTVYPNLRMLSEMPEVETIDYFTVERSSDQLFKDSFPPIAKVKHHPIPSKNFGLSVLTKIADWQRIRGTILAQAKHIKPDLVICRSAMAGPFGTLLYKKLGIPFVVESFEPHADYMFESGVWEKNGMKYRFQLKQEEEIKKYATMLIAVSHNYYRYLHEHEGVALARLDYVPCMVDAEQFSFDQQQRETIRIQLNIAEYTTVGIYLGKFGSIYYDAEAFDLFKAAHDFFKGHFFLILLTPTPIEEIQQKLSAVDFPLEKTWIHTVPHAQVPHYLSAADFAFSTIKPAHCRKFCSPIKDGEYWANGLPILLPDGIGDDSDIIKAEGGGAIVDLHDPRDIQQALERLQSQMTKEEMRGYIKQLAVKHRNFDIGKKVYEKIMQRFAA